MLKKLLTVAVVVLIGLAAFTAKGADTLPAQYTDAEFWRIVNDFSEPGGTFPYENFVSNEVSYMDIIPDLTRVAKTGGAYLGVAPEQNFTYASATPNNGLPSYYNLMVATDGRGKNWAYLDTEDRYQYVRQLQQKNLIIPLVADFGGTKTIKEIGKYLKEHGATVSVFYISNVEDYLETTWNNYKANIAALPSDDSTLLIRFIPRANTVLGRPADLPHRWPGIYWH